MASKQPALVALLVLLASCSSTAEPESLSSSPAAPLEAPSEQAGQDLAAASAAPLVALPTHGQPLVRPGGTGSMMQALIAGRLAGDPELDGGCVWLESGDARISVLWPAGFGVRFLPAGPFQLVDERGEIVAHEGDQLEAAGGYGDGQTPRCRVGNGPAILQGELTVTARADV